MSGKRTGGDGGVAAGVRAGAAEPGAVDVGLCGVDGMGGSVTSVARFDFEYPSRFREFGEVGEAG